MFFCSCCRSFRIFLSNHFLLIKIEEEEEMYQKWNIAWGSKNRMDMNRREIKISHSKRQIITFSSQDIRYIFFLSYNPQMTIFACIHLVAGNILNTISAQTNNGHGHFSFLLYTYNSISFSIRCNRHVLSYSILVSCVFVVFDVLADFLPTTESSFWVISIVW